MVQSDKVNDDEATILSHDIAKNRRRSFLPWECKNYSSKRGKGFATAN
ncbi:hypothetical protein CM15mP43_10400 [bacterium]|nr:MAG: hypothetical protein CM15mP43_10400 [bacterium]